MDIGAFESQGFTLTVTSGNNQSAPVKKTFGQSLKVAVAANNPIEPVDGGVVTFTAPTTGASAMFFPPTTTISGGSVSVNAAANGILGSYVAQAGATGASTAASFSLNNVAVVWTGLGPDNLWSDSANWQNNQIPSNGSYVVFPDGPTKLLSYDDLDSLPLNSINFSGIQGGYTITGNEFSLSGGVSVAGGSDIFNVAQVDLSASQSFALLSNSSNLAFGTTTAVNFSNLTLTITGTASNTITFAGGLPGNGTLLLQGPVLQQAGSVSGPLAVTTGALSPAINNMPAILMAPSVTFGSGGTYQPIVNGTVAGSGYSQLIVSGAVALNGSTLNLKLGFTPQLGDQFVIIQTQPGTGLITGTFAGLPDGSAVVFDGQTFVINYITVESSLAGIHPYLEASSQVILTSKLALGTFTLTSSPVTPAAGDTFTLTATISGAEFTPTGTVTFFNNGSPVGSSSIIAGIVHESTLGTGTVTNGIATFTVAGFVQGTYAISASYSGDTNFAPASTTSSAIMLDVGPPLLLPPIPAFSPPAPMPAAARTSPSSTATAIQLYKAHPYDDGA